MRLPVLVAALALSLGPASAKAPSSSPISGSSPFDCNNNLLHYAHKDGKAAGLRRLGELPPGNLHLTVVREVDGCHEPVIVRYGIGMGERETPASRAPLQMPPRPRLIR
jgi:hypothetical protein